ncbi:MAG: stage II sporulation protein M [Bacillota bacterium]|jgi:stage II sporulation protein M
MLAAYKELLPRYRRYFFTATTLFLLGLGLGIAAAIYNPELIAEAFKMIGEQLERLGEDILGSPVEQGIKILFWHNLRAVLLVVFLGLALGVYPAFSMLFNGMIIGVVGVVSVGSASLAAFLAGIVPHGIFEIPGLLLGAAIGLRLGLGPLLSRKKSAFAISGPTTWKGYGQELRDAVILLTLAVLLLAVAAVIEVVVTPYLIQFWL